MKPPFLLLLSILALLAPADAQVTPGLPGGGRRLASVGSGSAAPLAGSSATVRALELDAREERVAFLVRAGGITRLFAVKATGGPPLELSAPFVAGRQGVIDFRLSPDGRRVLYLADHAPAFELYSVSIEGGAVVKIVRPSSIRSIDPSAYAIAPDSKRALFVDLESGRGELYMASLTSGASTRISNDPGSVPIQGFRATPDGESVVFEIVSGFTGPYRIFSAPLDGSAEPSELAQGGVVFGHAPFEISPDSKHVVFASRIGDAGLFSVPVDGSAPMVQLSGDPVVDGRVADWRITADSGGVVYTTFRATLASVFSVPILGTAPATVISTGAEGRNVVEFQLSASGQVAYVSNPVSGRFELFGAPVTGGAAPIALSPPGGSLVLSTGTGSWGPVLGTTPDGLRGLFCASDSAGHHALYGALLDGSSPALVIATLAPSELLPDTHPLVDWRGTVIDPVTGRFVYLVVDAAFSAASPVRLFSVPSEGSAAAVELTAPTPPGAEGVRDFALGSRTGFVYFASDQLEAGVLELFRVPVDGSGAPKLLVDL